MKSMTTNGKAENKIWFVYDISAFVSVRDFVIIAILMIRWWNSNKNL